MSAEFMLEDPPPFRTMKLSDKVKIVVALVVVYGIQFVLFWRIAQ